MKNFVRVALCCSVFAGAAAASPGNGVKADSAARLMSLMPTEPLAVLYARDPASVLGNPALAMSADRRSPALAEVAKAWKEVFGGPAVIAVQATALRPDAIGVSFGATLSGDAGQLLDGLQTRLAPALSKFGDEPMIEIGRDGEMVTVRPMLLPMVTLYLGVRDGLLFGNTRRSAVVGFLAGPGPEVSFVDGDDFKRLPAVNDLRTSRGDLLAYLNLRPLMPLIRAQMGEELPHVFDALELNDIKAVALAADWSGERMAINLSISVAEEAGRLARLVAPVSGKPTSALGLPGHYLLVLGGAMTTASDSVDRVCELAELIDPEVVEEYRAELAEVTGEFGFDPQHDFLGNMIDEWAFGVGVTDDGKPYGLGLVKLADPDLFVNHLRNLVTGYRLPIDTRVYSGVEILSRAGGRKPSVSLAVVEGRLAVAGSAEAIVELVDAGAQNRTLGDTAAVKELDRALPSPVGRLAYLNVARFAQLALAEEGLDCDDPAAAAFRALADTDAMMGLAVSRSPNLIALDAAFSGAATATAANLLAQSLVASIERSRHLSQRMVSAANVKGILTGCLIYANDHKGALPDSLSELVADGWFALDILRSPYDGQGPGSVEEVDESSFYLYRPGVNIKELKDPSSVLIVAEREVILGEGANFGFGDGHAEWVAEPDASRLLAELRRHID